MDNMTRNDLKSISSAALAGCIVWIFLFFPAWICWIVAGAKALSIRDEEIKHDLNVVAILTIVLGLFTIIGGIVCAAILRSKAMYHLKGN